MSNFNKMTPAPWSTDGIRLWGRSQEVQQPLIGQLYNMNDLSGVCDLRNALDVQIRRKWWAKWDGSRWIVCDIFGTCHWFESAQNPAIAILEADAYYKMHVDSNVKMIEDFYKERIND